MPNFNEHNQSHPPIQGSNPETQREQGQAREVQSGERRDNPTDKMRDQSPMHIHDEDSTVNMSTENPSDEANNLEGRPGERQKGAPRLGARGTAAMDVETRKEVARKGGLAVSRNRQHMADIGRKGGQTVSKNREHMAVIGRKGGAASRGHR